MRQKRAIFKPENKIGVGISYKNTQGIAQCLDKVETINQKRFNTKIRLSASQV